MKKALSALLHMHIQHIYICLEVLYCMCNYDYFHIFGSMKLLN